MLRDAPALKRWAAVCGRSLASLAFAWYPCASTLPLGRSSGRRTILGRSSEKGTRSSGDRDDQCEIVRGPDDRWQEGVLRARRPARPARVSSCDEAAIGSAGGRSASASASVGEGEAAASRRRARVDARQGGAVANLRSIGDALGVGTARPCTVVVARSKGVRPSMSFSWVCAAPEHIRDDFAAAGAGRPSGGPSALAIRHRARARDARRRLWTSVTRCSRRRPRRAGSRAKRWPRSDLLAGEVGGAFAPKPVRARRGRPRRSAASRR